MLFREAVCVCVSSPPFTFTSLPFPRTSYRLVCEYVDVLCVLCACCQSVIHSTKHYVVRSHAKLDGTIMWVAGCATGRIGQEREPSATTVCGEDGRKRRHTKGQTQWRE